VPTGTDLGHAPIEPTPAYPKPEAYIETRTPEKDSVAPSEVHSEPVPQGGVPGK